MNFSKTFLNGLCQLLFALRDSKIELPVHSTAVYANWLNILQKRYDAELKMPTTTQIEMPKKTDALLELMLFFQRIVTAIINDGVIFADIAQTHGELLKTLYLVLNCFKSK